MNADIKGKDVVVSNVRDFLLSQTLECGQCFHFVRLGEEDYVLSAMGRCLHVSQRGDNLIFHDTSMEDYVNIWEKYFDLDRDYGAIKAILLEKDDALKPAIDAMWGVRILNQDFFETLISFIISQNQQIVRIKQIVAGISYNCGRELAPFSVVFPDAKTGCSETEGKSTNPEIVLKGVCYSFPDADAMLAAGVERIRECKAGFRSPYIIDACEKYKSGIINEKELRAADYTDCIEMLKQIKGVGDKVANCVALFSLGKRNAFPVDVWIKRIMESIYFGKETPIARIQTLADEKYGEYGGYAQQYLFYFGKVNEIGKKTRK